MDAPSAIKVKIGPNDVNGSPKILAPSLQTRSDASQGYKISWKIGNGCLTHHFWVQMQGFHLVSGAVNIPTIFNKFVTYAFEFPVGLNFGVLESKDVVYEGAPDGSEWKYSILLIDETGIIDMLDPFVVLSGGVPKYQR